MEAIFFDEVMDELGDIHGAASRQYVSHIKLDDFSNQELLKNFRFRREEILHFIELVLGDIGGLSQPSMSRVVNGVTNILFEIAVGEINMPTSHAEIRKQQTTFYNKCGIPKIIGAIDGTQIPIKGPSTNEEVYINRKGFHSINVQAVCDSEKRFTSINSKFPGSTHDSYIWNNTQLKERFTRGDFANGVLLGKGLPIKNNV